MKTLLILLLLSSMPVFAQTGLIAHKSHSGTALTYSFADPGNFGAPSPRVVSVKWVNDTTVVQKLDRWGGNREDTVYNHPIYCDPNIPLDSIRNGYWGGVEFIDTNKRLKSENVRNPSKGRTKPVKAKTSQDRPSPKMTEDEPVKKTKSALWFIIIGGGTFTGMMLLTKRKKIQPAR